MKEENETTTNSSSIVELPNAAPEDNDTPVSNGIPRAERNKLILAVFAYIAMCAIVIAIPLALMPKGDNNKNASTASSELPKAILSVNNCPLDVKLCGDQKTYVGRTGSSCAWGACPETGTGTGTGDVQSDVNACTLDIKQCGDGSTRSRSGPNCDFQSPCQEDLIVCPLDVRYCESDGRYHSRHPDTNCEFKPCQEAPLVCPLDVKHCATDNSYVNRDPANNCDFKPCPSDLLPICPMDVKYCGPDDIYVDRDPASKCEFKVCPSDLSICPMDIQYCPDGSTVIRSGPDCEFEPCSAPIN